MPDLVRGIAMWEKFLISMGMKIIDHLTKRGLINIDKEQTRKDIRDEISQMLSGKAPPENIKELLDYANNKLGPFDEDVKSLRRVSTGHSQAIAKKASKKFAAKKKVAAKKRSLK